MLLLIDLFYFSDQSPKCPAERTIHVWCLNIPLVVHCTIRKNFTVDIHTSSLIDSFGSLPFCSVITH